MMINLAVVVPNFAADMWNMIALPLQGLADLIVLGFVMYNFVHSRAEDGGRSSFMGHLLVTGMELIGSLALIYVLFTVVPPIIGL